MRGHSAGGGPSTTTTDDGPGERDVAAWWVASIVSLDQSAAFFTFVAAGGYLVLKALNDRHSALMRVIERVTVVFYSLGIDQLPGLPHDYATLRQFGIPSFADAYMITMAALHLLATAGLLALAHGLGGFHAWARRAHIRVAVMILLVLGSYAAVYARSDWPAIGLVVIASGAVVPAAVIAILMVPRVDIAFIEGGEPGRRTRTAPGSRHDFPLRIALGLFLALNLIGILAIVMIASASAALQIRMALPSAP